MMLKKSGTVAVVMGGPSSEAEISLSTGKGIAGALREKGYEVAEIRLNPRDFSEQLKASDPMAWVGLMNTCKAQAEEVILTELIYS